MSFLLGQYLPEPPAIIASLNEETQEAVANDRERARALSKSNYERYAADISNGLARVISDACGPGIDFERIIYELAVLEKRSAKTLKETEQSLILLKKATRRALPGAAKGKIRPADLVELRQHAVLAAWLIPLMGKIVANFQNARRELEAMRDIRLAVYATEWEDYLARLKSITPIATETRQIWSHLKSCLWAPEATPTDEGFTMLWDRGPHHLQVEVLLSGLYDWFYRNRDTDEIIGQEDLALSEYSKLDAVVARIVAS